MAAHIYAATANAVNRAENHPVDHGLYVRAVGSAVANDFQVSTGAPSRLGPHDNAPRLRTRGRELIITIHGRGTFAASQTLATASGWAFSPGRSISFPLMKAGPARTRATRCGPLTARQRSCAEPLMRAHMRDKRAPRSG